MDKSCIYYTGYKTLIEEVTNVSVFSDIRCAVRSMSTDVSENYVASIFGVEE
jgi:hypothetical protein